MTIINNNGYKVDLFVYIHLFIYNLTPGINSIRWSGHFGDNSFMYTICEGHMTLCLPACGAIFDLISLSLISQFNRLYIFIEVFPNPSNITVEVLFLSARGVHAW